ncbi:MAG: hypothetical protein HOK81_10435 [Rhodospirillaceae bacterium]|jgi:hypothetical protein|nr:hypothetical protein [Rhodospirillaceae bacterium]
MSDVTVATSNPIPACNPAPLTRLGNMARKARDLALVGLAWGGSWVLVVVVGYGAVQAL